MSEYIKRIVKATAQRAKFLFDKYQFTWGKGVPSLTEIEDHIRWLVDTVIENKYQYTSCGRITILSYWRDDGEFEDIEICFHLGYIPYLYLNEEYGGKHEADLLEEENARAKK